MTLTKQESKEIKNEVDELLGEFYDSVFDCVTDMYFADFKKQEITKILIRDLKIGINIEYKILRKNHPNHDPCPLCEERLKQ